jgi:SAM-dependent methyltransferase
MNSGSHERLRVIKELPLAGKVDALDARFYPNYRCEDDVFREMLDHYVQPGGLVLDAGCGSGRFAHALRDRCRVVGVDLTPDVARNTSVDAAIVANLGSLPLADNCVALCFSKYVLEHLEDPGAVFNEVARVLRPGGVFLFHTPNRFHYVPVIARLLPHGLHRRINAARGRDEADTFVTFYRANSPGAIRRLAERAGLEVESLALVESKPNYLVFSRLTYLAGIAYERLVNRVDFLAPLRVNIFGVLRKPKV